MWLKGNMLYVKKRPPKVTLKLSASDGKIRAEACFVDYEHRYRYAEEIEFSSSITKTHGIVYRSSSFGIATAITASGMKRLNFGAYSDDGTFTYNLDSSLYGSSSRRNWYKAWIAYVDPETGEKNVAYSNVIATTYNELL